MKDALIASLPLASYPATRKSLRNRLLVAVAAIATLSMVVLNLFCREAYTGDEGFYGVTALNMLRSPSYILRPSFHPVGDFLADKDAFAHPPLNSYFYAISFWISRGSLAGPEFLNGLFYALLFYFAYRLLKLFDVSAAWFSALLLAASPAILGSYAQLEAEPLMVTFGVAALYFCLRGGFGPGENHWLFLSGLCLGFSFALKLWLCAPLGLAVVVALGLRARQANASTRARVIGWLLFGMGGLLPAGAHLLAIASFYPQDLGFWLKNIYFGVFTNMGISGAKLTATGVSTDWIHPFWYYAAVVYRDNFFLVPIILLGVGPVLREEPPRRQLFWILLAGASGLLPLSIMKVKEPLYVLSCVVFLYLLAGLCLAALVRRMASGPPLNALTTRLATSVIIGLMIVFPLAYARGMQPGKITAAFVSAHTIVLALFLMAFWTSWRKKSPALLEWSAFGACALTILLEFGHGALTRHPRDKIITRMIEPYIQANSLDALSMIASNYKGYQFYTFRRGCYWQEIALAESPEVLLNSAPFKSARVFIFEPDDLAKPEVASWARWLEAHALEKTAEVDAQAGSISGWRLFVR